MHISKQRKWLLVYPELDGSTLKILIPKIYLNLSSLVGQVVWKERVDFSSLRSIYFWNGRLRTNICKNFNSCKETHCYTMLFSNRSLRTSSEGRVLRQSYWVNRGLEFTMGCQRIGYYLQIFVRTKIFSSASSASLRNDSIRIGGYHSKMLQKFRLTRCKCSRSLLEVRNRH